MKKLTDMNVGMASASFMYSFSEVFPSIEVVPLEKDKYPEYDLVIFPGGGDIHPKLYGEDLSNQCSGVSTVRDDREINVLEDIVKTGRIKCPLVFGACRGLQILNAYFGGSLYQDLQEKRHNGHHEINWETDANVGALAQLRIANSLHHQGIKIPAENARILGREPKTGVVEMAEFAHETVQIFASQFHPEFFRDEKREWFFDALLTLAKERSK